MSSAPANTFAALLVAVFGIAVLLTLTQGTPRGENALYAATTTRGSVSALTRAQPTWHRTATRVAADQGRHITGLEEDIPLPSQLDTAPVAKALATGVGAIVGALVGFFLGRGANRPAPETSEAGGLTRREALAATSLLLGGVSVAGRPAPAQAAYGDSANVFGKKAEPNQVLVVKGDGWTGTMPGKYNPSKEREFPGTVGRWEDNFDSISNASVIIRPPAPVDDLDTVRQKFIVPLLGLQTFEGDTISEGGFGQGKVATSSLLSQEVVEKNGKKYLEFELLTRTADGDEGGKHQLFSVTTGPGGRVYILKHQAGDKRWFKGLDKAILQSMAAFTVE